MFNSKLGKKEKKNDTNFLPSLQLLIHRVYYLRKERRNIIKSTMSRKIASKKNNAYIQARKTRISGLRTQLLSDKRNRLFFATENAQEMVA